ncbi:MAG TPA: hypothetical protein VHZ55_14890 [Bryobacteraceae bacterium]|nr:hypothetical protein [Bryobacteraceae bacterium]
MAANAKPALEKIRRIQKTKKQRYSEQYLKIVQNSVQSNVPIRRQHPGALLEGSEGIGLQPFFFKGVQRSAEIRLLSIEDSAQPTRQDLDKSFTVDGTQFLEKRAMFAHLPPKFR